MLQADTGREASHVTVLWLKVPRGSSCILHLLVHWSVCRWHFGPEVKLRPVRFQFWRTHRTCFQYSERTFASLPRPSVFLSLVGGILTLRLSSGWSTLTFQGHRLYFQCSGRSFASVPWPPVCLQVCRRRSGPGINVSVHFSFPFRVHSCHFFFSLCSEWTCLFVWCMYQYRDLPCSCSVFGMSMIFGLEVKAYGQCIFNFNFKVRTCYTCAVWTLTCILSGSLSGVEIKGRYYTSLLVLICWWIGCSVKTV